MFEPYFFVIVLPLVCLSQQDLLGQPHQLLLLVPELLGHLVYPERLVDL